jgi:hypothetical protein
MRRCRNEVFSAVLLLIYLYLTFYLSYNKLYVKTYSLVVKRLYLEVYVGDVLQRIAVFCNTLSNIKLAVRDPRLNRSTSFFFFCFVRVLA